MIKTDPSLTILQKSFKLEEVKVFFSFFEVHLVRFETGHKKVIKSQNVFQPKTKLKQKSRETKSLRVPPLMTSRLFGFFDP